MSTTAPAARRGKAARRRRATEVVERLAKIYPGSAKDLCALQHGDPFQLLVATILSAQCTDAKVNEVTPALFSAYPGPREMASANPERLEEQIRPTGFFRSKTRSLMGMSAVLVENFDGQVPTELDDLVTLPGVGRKTGNVVRSVGFDLPGLPVDTHVGRIARRLGLVDTDDPVHAEEQLADLVPPADWGALSLRLILHGRQTCTARKPHCDRCILQDICPSSTVRLIAQTGTPSKAAASAKTAPRTKAAASAKTAPSTNSKKPRNNKKASSAKAPEL